jgi:hypothetical protein
MHDKLQDMKEKRLHKETRRTDIVFGVSIIVLAFVVGLIANSVITGHDLPFLSSAPAEPAPPTQDMEIP